MNKTVNFQQKLPKIHYTISKLRSVHEQVLLSHLVSKCGLSCDGLTPQATLDIFCGGQIYSTASSSKANTRLAVYATAEEATQAFEALQVTLNN